MAEIGRLLRTAAHLTPAQGWHRIRLTARRAIWERRSSSIDARYRERASRLPAARFDDPGLARVADFRTGSRGEDLERIAAEALAGRFRFLNRTRDFGRVVDWYHPDLDVGTRLWKTHLHEFPFAPALALAHRGAPEAGYRTRLFELVESWSSASPIGRPEFALDAWNGRAVATRLCHWAVAASLLGLRADEPDGRNLGRAIGLHGLFLRDNLELDLQGNHLLRDTTALVFADRIVGGVPDALALLEAQVREQVLPDGCHVERAPMYHAICLLDLLEVQLLLGGDSPAWLSDAVARMAGLLDFLLLGDGDLPLLGDGWLGEVDVSHLLAACREIAGELPAPVGPERHGGLVALHRGPVRAVMRAGPHGPDYMLGHAHADLLSFDLSQGTRRVVTDTGTALYDPGPERQQLRSTAAHNTLQIDGEEQLEAWGSFRVGRRGRARVVAMGDAGTWSWVWASADAFRWLAGQPEHARLLAVCERAVLALDVVTGTGRHDVASRLHLHPDLPDNEARVLALSHGMSRRIAPFHGRFGESREMARLEVSSNTELPWVGGWLIQCGEAPYRSDSSGVESELRIADDVVSLNLRGGFDLAATWNLAAPSAVSEAADAVSFCSPERQSAT